jgi:hypothetical protein
MILPEHHLYFQPQPARLLGVNMKHWRTECTVTRLYSSSFTRPYSSVLSVKCHVEEVSGDEVRCAEKTSQHLCPLDGVWLAGLKMFLTPSLGAWWAGADSSKGGRDEVVEWQQCLSHQLTLIQ